MRALHLSLLSLLLLSSAAAVVAAELPCGTSPENDARVRALHERVRERRSRTVTEAVSRPLLRDGAFYVQGDEDIIPGYRPFDLEGQSLVFEPKSGNTFTVRREQLQYVEPAGPPVHDFGTGATIERGLQFAFPIFGRTVTSVFVTAFNSIHFDPPSEPSAAQMNALEATTYRQAVLSPLMMTTRKPSRLAYPELFVTERAGSVVFTWRSSAGPAFGYDVQAELRADGSIVYSYRSMRATSWGTPIVSPGFDPVSVPRSSLASVTDASGDVPPDTPAVLRPMADILGAEVTRIDGSEVYSVRLRLAAPIDPSGFEGNQSLRYVIGVNGEFAYLDVSATGTRVFSPGSPFWVPNGSVMRVDGDTIELFGLQADPAETRSRPVIVNTYALPNNRRVDFASFSVPFTAATKRVATDFSSLSTVTELTAPIAEPFVVPELNTYAVWEKLQAAFPHDAAGMDGVLIYQKMFTDIIFYAGAYATGGNPQVDGIADPNELFGQHAPREPSLMHMNQLTYGWNSTELSASNVMLHEFGHRWLYFIRIMEDGSPKRSLNPSSSHPAGYVHAPAAFRVTGADDESSVMGGGFFTTQPDGRFRARALNVGYSWPDLYLMGLAAPEEVSPWFYLADTNPPLPGEYWPADGAIVSATKRDVHLQQIVDVHGARQPSAATAQKVFRTAFVLVTEPGVEPSPADIAKLNEWRALFERNFSIATGGRGRAITTFVKGGRRRAVGH